MTAARADSRAAHLPTSPTSIRVNQSRRRAAAATNGEPRNHVGKGAAPAPRRRTWRHVRDSHVTSSSLRFPFAFSLALLALRRNQRRRSEALRVSRDSWTLFFPGSLSEEFPSDLKWASRAREVSLWKGSIARSLPKVISHRGGTGQNEREKIKERTPTKRTSSMAYPQLPEKRAPRFAMFGLVPYVHSRKLGAGKNIAAVAKCGPKVKVRNVLVRQPSKPTTDDISHEQLSRSNSVFTISVSVSDAERHQNQIKML